MPSDPSASLYHAWLASAGLPADTILALLEQWNTPKNVYDALLSGDEVLSKQLSATGIQKLKTCGRPRSLDLLAQKLESCRIWSLTISDELYPFSLRQIPDPPAILFFQGNLDCLSSERLLAMVGSRAASFYGQKATRQIARELSSHGVTIISGMATGIDASAHRGCLEGNSPTVAIMGCGLDQVYPAEHVKLREEILNQGGLLLSEYAPGEKPLGWHFPVRNRIIVGLSLALVLMEAKIRSGSMTTVQHALNQGKDVYTWAGDATSPHFEGNHQLLREGATFFTTASHLLEDFGWLDNPHIIGQNSQCAIQSTSSNPEETAVLRALEKDRQSFEELLAASRLSPSTLMSTLTMLQIRGLIEALPGKIYQIRR